MTKHLPISRRPLGLALMTIAVVALFVALLLPHHHHHRGAFDTSVELCLDGHHDDDEHSHDNADGACLQKESFVLTKQTSQWHDANVLTLCALLPEDTSVLFAKAYVSGYIWDLVETLYDSAVFVGGGLRAPPVC